MSALSLYSTDKTEERRHSRSSHASNASNAGLFFVPFFGRLSKGAFFLLLGFTGTVVTGENLETVGR